MKPINFKRGYTNYLLKGYSFIEEFYRNGHGIVADLWTTRYDEMKNIKIPIPPKEEQTAIANFLDNKTTKIDQAIAQKEKLIELLKERKQILIQNAVTGKVVWNKEKKRLDRACRSKRQWCGMDWGDSEALGVQGTKVYFKRKK
jgi:restriction endonuclease S subunit